MRTALWIILAWSVALPALAQDAGACPPGVEFCEPPPPCYRAPDDPDCNPDCHCMSPDYPECDPRCAPGDICDPSCANPCWDEFARDDICSDPPPPCTPPPNELPFTFTDDRDGVDDGQIFVIGNNPSRAQACGTITVDETGYYAIFDTELSESCDDQRDETGYLTVSNFCNTEGWAVERNAGDRFLVADSDNSPDCTMDIECAADEVCRANAGGHGRCCVPNAPVFMGTFLLVAGEDNVICINHWCPEWAAENREGRDFGFVGAGCVGQNSIHFRIGATAIACIDETTLNACSWGCGPSGCHPDPCDSVSCPRYCMDGVCTDTNPCDSVSCLHGCANGRCLQNRHARGPDADGDGYSLLADCDDNDPTIHPGRPEVCGDELDNDCDGDFDETECVGSEPDAGPPGPDASGVPMDGGAGGAVETGCGCRASAPETNGAAAWSLMVLIVGFRRRGGSFTRA